MLEELRETVLTDLEQRVERAIDLIEQLRQDKIALESQIGELNEQIQEKDEYIVSLEKRNAELQYAESELGTLRAQQEQERENINVEKAELRDRLEGVMQLLNGTEDRPETSLEQPSAAEAESTETSESTVDEGTGEVSESLLGSDAATAEEAEATAGADEPITESPELSFAEDEPTETSGSTADEEAGRNN